MWTATAHVDRVLNFPVHMWTGKQIGVNPMLRCVMCKLLCTTKKCRKCVSFQPLLGRDLNLLKLMIWFAIHLPTASSSIDNRQSTPLFIDTANKVDPIKTRGLYDDLRLPSFTIHKFSCALCGCDHCFPASQFEQKWCIHITAPVQECDESIRK